MQTEFNKLNLKCLLLIGNRANECLLIMWDVGKHGVLLIRFFIIIICKQ